MDDYNFINIEELPFAEDVARIRSDVGNGWTIVFIPSSFVDSMDDHEFAMWERSALERGAGETVYFNDVSGCGDIACFSSRAHAESVICSVFPAKFTIIE